MGVKGKKSAPGTKKRTRPAEAAPRPQSSPAPAEPVGGGDGEREPVRRPGTSGPRRRGTELSTKIASSVTLVATLVIAVVLNIFAARHYTRWDLTKGGEFTLSDGTLDTLRSLDQTVHVIVLLSRDTPVGTSLSEVLDGYRAHTDKLDIEFIDPDLDEDRARLVEVQKKYNLIAGNADGHVVTDAAMVVVLGDRTRYVLNSELIQVEDAEDMRVRPRFEYAITSAIRQVRSAERTTLCFTTGHGEPSLDAGGYEGMAELRDRLTKNNFEVVTVFEPTANVARDPLESCDLLVISVPKVAMAPEQVAQIKAYIERGGNALIVVGPIPNPGQSGWNELGLSEILATAGVALEQDYVFEADPTKKTPRGGSFFAEARAHPVTERLMREERTGAGALLGFASSLRDLGSDVKPEPILVTSSSAFGVVDYFQRQTSDRDMRAEAQDHKGPLTVGVAAQRQPPPGKERGARIVVISALNPLFGVNWTNPEFNGTQLLMEGAFAWLASHERFLDIPDKELKTTGLRITQESMDSAFRYVVVVIPTVVVLFGILILILRRRRPERARSTERA